MHTLDNITCFEVRILTDSLLYVHLDLAGDLAGRGHRMVVNDLLLHHITVGLNYSCLPPSIILCVGRLDI